VGQGEVHPKGENSMGLGFRKVALFGPFLSSFLQMGLEMIYVQWVHFVPLQLFNNFGLRA